MRNIQVLRVGQEAHIGSLGLSWPTVNLGQIAACQERQTNSSNSTEVIRVLRRRNIMEISSGSFIVDTSSNWSKPWPLKVLLPSFFIQKFLSHQSWALREHHLQLRNHFVYEFKDAFRPRMSDEDVTRQALRMFHQCPGHIPGRRSDWFDVLFSHRVHRGPDGSILTSKISTGIQVTF